MMIAKAIGPDGQVHGYEATRFVISERRDSVMIMEPGKNFWMELRVDEPDGANHIYIESASGKTVESIHRGSIKDK